MILKKEIQEIKESIKDFNDKSKREKRNLLDSIEMLWLNADIQRKKESIDLPDHAEDNVNRIRQLLASAWSEDYKK